MYCTVRIQILKRYVLRTHVQCLRISIRISHAAVNDFLVFVTNIRTYVVQCHIQSQPFRVKSMCLMLCDNLYYLPWCSFNTMVYIWGSDKSDIWVIYIVIYWNLCSHNKLEGQGYWPPSCRYPQYMWLSCTCQHYVGNTCTGNWCFCKLYIDFSFLSKQTWRKNHFLFIKWCDMSLFSKSCNMLPE